MEEAAKFEPVNRRTLNFYRILSLMVSILFVVRPLILDKGDAWDPYWMRLVLGGLLGSLTIGNFFIPSLRRNTFLVLYGTGLLIVVWLFALAFKNDFDLGYSRAAFLGLISMALVYRHFRFLLAFFVTTFVFSVCLFNIPQDPVFDPTLFYLAEVVVMIGLGIVMDRQINERASLQKKESRQRLITDSAFEYSGDGIMVVDPDGRVLEFNRRYLEMWPLDENDLRNNQKDPIRYKMAPLVEDQEAFLFGIEESYRMPSKQYSEIIKLLDGQYFERFSAPLKLGDELLGRIWFYRDVTRRYLEKEREEEKSRLLMAENQALLELASIIGNQDVDRREKLKQIAERSLEVLQAQSVGIWLYDHSSLCFKCSLTLGQMRAAVEFAPIEVGSSPDFPKAMAQVRVLAARAVGQDPVLHSLEAENLLPTGAAAICIPLRAGGQVAGFIYVQDHSPERDWSEEEIGFAGSLGDIGGVALESARRREAEMLLREKLAVLKAVFEMSGTGILVTNQQGGSMDYNADFLEMWGLSDEEASRGNEGIALDKMRSFLVDAQQAREAEDFIKNQPEGERLDIFRLTDGRIIERNTRALLIEGEVVGRLWFYRDITARVNDEEALRYSESQNRAIVEAVPDLLIRMDVTGYILNFRLPAAGEYEEWVSPDAQTIEEMFPESLSGQVLEMSLSALEIGQTEQVELRLELAGKMRDLEIRVVRSRPGEVLAIIREVTQRKAAERELIQRNFELDSFVYRASHDLKAPLNSLMGLIDILMSEDIAEEQLRFIKMMDRSVVKLDTFIRNLNEFSRIARLEMVAQEIDIEQIVHEIHESLQYMEDAGRVEVRVVAKEKAKFSCDRFHIEVVLSNLISNAIKYQDHSKEKSWVEVRLAITETEARIEISDNGIGIPKAFQSRLFELFFRASNQSFGSGLGLYITQNAVRKLGGNVTVESEPGEGTTFFIRIPQLRAEVKVGQADAESLPATPTDSEINPKQKF